MKPANKEQLLDMAWRAYAYLEALPDHNDAQADLYMELAGVVSRYCRQCLHVLTKKCETAGQCLWCLRPIHHHEPKPNAQPATLGGSFLTGYGPGGHWDLTPVDLPKQKELQGLCRSEWELVRQGNYIGAIKSLRQRLHTSYTHHYMGLKEAKTVVDNARAYQLSWGWVRVDEELKELGEE
jgi:hypothetical protein